jgi:hypothetical protein
VRNCVLKPRDGEMLIGEGTPMLSTQERQLLADIGALRAPDAAADGQDTAECLEELLEATVRCSTWRGSGHARWRSIRKGTRACSRSKARRALRNPRTRDESCCHPSK